MGLPTDAIVGIQLPNIVENILTILGVLRAEMIAAPLPLLWRRAEADRSAWAIGAKALITCGHVGAFNHADFALHLAADVFSIRYVCAFGENLPDGEFRSTILWLRRHPDPPGRRIGSGRVMPLPTSPPSLSIPRRRHCAGGAQSF